MNECYSGPIKGSAGQTRGCPPASPGQTSGARLPYQNTADSQRNVAPLMSDEDIDAEVDDILARSRVLYEAG